MATSKMATTKAVPTKAATAKVATTRKANKVVEDPQETSESLAQQVEDYLASGGQIQEIPQGVSGQVATTGPRHITLGRRKSE